MAKVQFTAGRVRDFTCPPDKTQAFLWDIVTPGLGLRVTPNGKPAYVFQKQHAGKTVRQTIGSPDAWTIEQARTKARELQRQIDEGNNPAEVKREAQAAKEAERERVEAEAEARRQQEQREAVTVGEAWAVYLEARKQHWGELHYQSHIDKASPGGVPSKARGQFHKLTTPGPLASLMSQNAQARTLRAHAEQLAVARGPDITKAAAPLSDDDLSRIIATRSMPERARVHALAERARRKRERV